MSDHSLAPAAPAAAQFACSPHRDGTNVQAFLFHPDGTRPLLSDAVDAVSADARSDLLDRFDAAAAAEEYAFDRIAADRDLIAQTAVVVAATPRLAAGLALERLGLTVVSTGEDESLFVYSAGTGRTHRIPRVAKMEFEDLLQLLGPDRAALAVRKRNGSSPPGSAEFKEVKEALALAAATAPRSRDGGRGRGVWPTADAKPLINDGGSVYRYDGDRTVDHDAHDVDGRPVIRGGGVWAGTGLRGALDGMDDARAAAAYGRLEGLLAQWRWTTPGGAALAAALIVATFVQAVLRFRPRVAVVGVTNSGKTTLVEKILKPLFGGPADWALIFDDATAAGVRQSVGDDSPPLVLDEFENEEQRGAVLKLLRSASRGARMVRGTAGQIAHAIELRLLAWVLCIEAGDLPAQDRNRQIVLSLDAPDKDSAAPVVPPVAELYELRTELIAAAVWAVRSANGIADRIQTPCPVGVDRRLTESLALPAAFDAVLRGGVEVDDARARSSLETFLAGLGDAEPADTGRDLLDALCAAPVLFDGRKYSVGELVMMRFGLAKIPVGPRSSDKKDVDRALGLAGLRAVGRRGKSADSSAKPPGLLVTNAAGNFLLPGTPWDGMDLKTVLLRVEGVFADTQRINGRPDRGALVPLDVLDLKNDDVEDQKTKTRLRAMRSED